MVDAETAVWDAMTALAAADPVDGHEEVRVFLAALSDAGYEVVKRANGPDGAAS